MRLRLRSYKCGASDRERTENGPATDRPVRSRSVQRPRTVRIETRRTGKRVQRTGNGPRTDRKWTAKTLLDFTSVFGRGGVKTKSPPVRNGWGDTPKDSKDQKVERERYTADDDVYYPKARRDTHHSEPVHALTLIQTDARKICFRPSHTIR